MALALWSCQHNLALGNKPGGGKRGRRGGGGGAVRLAPPPWRVTHWRTTHWRVMANAPTVDTKCKSCLPAAGKSHRLEICFEGLQSNFMDDTQRMGKLEVQCLNTVDILGGAAAPVAGAHEAPHACTGVQNMPDVLLRTICRVGQGSGSTAEGSCRGQAAQRRGQAGVGQESGSTAEGSCRGQAAQRRGHAGVRQHSRGVMQGSCRGQAAKQRGQAGVRQHSRGVTQGSSSTAEGSGRGQAGVRQHSISNGSSISIHSSTAQKHSLMIGWGTVYTRKSIGG